jgi:hypothetical protein
MVIEHYKQGIEPWSVIDGWDDPAAREGFYLGNAIKYLLRYGKKDDKNLEVRKAIHYLAKLLEELERQEELCKQPN